MATSCYYSRKFPHRQRGPFPCEAPFAGFEPAGAQLSQHVCRMAVSATAVVLGRQSPSSEQRNSQYANFVVITSGEGCVLNGTAIAAVFIDQ